MSALIPYGGDKLPTIVSDDDALDILKTTVDEVGITRGTLTRLKVPAGGATAFEVPTLGGSEYVKELHALIVYAKPNQRAWYAKAYEDSGGGTAPDCSSTNGVDGFGVRETDSNGDLLEIDPTPFRCGQPGQPGCCPWNEWESAGDGKAGKACAEQTHLFLFIEGQYLPLVLTVPPTSVKAYRSYASDLAKFGRKPANCVTKITLESGESQGGVTYSKLIFEHAGDVTAEQKAQLVEVAKMIKTSFADYDPQAQERAAAMATEAEATVVEPEPAEQAETSTDEATA